jgi:hypothetical protein
MTQTAVNISAETQYLSIASENQNAASDLTGLSEIKFKGSIIENTVFEQVAPFFYKKRVRLSLTVSGDYRTHLVMLRGLIEFNRAKHFVFDYQFQHGTIETDIDISQLADLQLFLKRTSAWLYQEIEFKQALKTVLAFENRYKLEKAGVYSALFAR